MKSNEATPLPVVVVDDDQEMLQVYRTLLKGHGAGHVVTFNGFPSIKEAQQQLISEALRMSNGNQGEAASLLGISRQALNNRLRRKMTPA